MSAHNLFAIARLNPEPTDAQRAAWRKHHARGTSPGNPKYYRSAELPKPRTFKAGRKPVYPWLPSGAEYHSRKGSKHLRKEEPLDAAKAKGDDIRAYVAAFDKASGFKDAYQ